MAAKKTANKSGINLNNLVDDFDGIVHFWLKAYNFAQNEFRLY